MAKTNYKLIMYYFLALANTRGEMISNLKLQKLLYYAQAWYLANFKQPLFEEDFQAWVHGPVISALYAELKSKGYFSITPIKSRFLLETIEKKIDDIDKKIKPFLEEVAKVYFQCGAYQLELMTHKEDPWIKARQGYKSDEKCTNIISKSSMLDYYASKI